MGCRGRNLDLGDPYHCECHKTARLLAQALGWRRPRTGSASSRARPRPLARAVHRRHVRGTGVGAA